MSDHVDDVLCAAPLQSPEIVEWHALVTDPFLGADEIDAWRRPFEPAALPDPRRFADMVATEAAAAAADGRLQHRIDARLDRGLMTPQARLGFGEACPRCSPHPALGATTLRADQRRNGVVDVGPIEQSSEPAVETFEDHVLPEVDRATG